LSANINNCVSYTVVAGDTCWGIASRYGLSLYQLTSLNSNINCNALQIGQIICAQILPTSIITNAITSTLAPVVTPSNCLTYTISNGDSCWSITALSGLTLNQLISLNPTLNCNNLPVGQPICVQTAPTTISSTTTYVPSINLNNCITYSVVPGDTCLSKIFFYKYY
jgi:LysM repeat protein